VLYNVHEMAASDQSRCLKLYIFSPSLADAALDSDAPQGNKDQVMVAMKDQKTKHQHVRQRLAAVSQLDTMLNERAMLGSGAVCHTSVAMLPSVQGTVARRTSDSPSLCLYERVTQYSQWPVDLRDSAQWPTITRWLTETRMLCFYATPVFSSESVCDRL
jgi:hypothetical protein